MRHPSRTLSVGLLLALSAAVETPAEETGPPTTAEVLERTTPGDWRTLDPENTLYLELESGRVVVELAPAFAPAHVDNVKKLARKGFFDGLTLYRVQENYVVQGGDADETRKDLSNGAVKAEFTRRGADALAFTPLPDPDGYAPEAGFASGLPAARNRATDEAWLVHCPGAFGMPRDVDPDGGTTDFYVVIGHAPRHLDRNTTVFGRVVHGMEQLTTLPRGGGNLGFYETPEERQPLKSIRVAADLPESERSRLELMRTDTASFAALIEARRNRREEWFHATAGYVEVCNVPLPVRETPAVTP